MSGFFVSSKTLWSVSLSGDWGAFPFRLMWVENFTPSKAPVCVLSIEKIVQNATGSSGNGLLAQFGQKGAGTMISC